MGTLTIDVAGGGQSNLHSTPLQQVSPYPSQNWYLRTVVGVLELGPLSGLDFVFYNSFLLKLQIVKSTVQLCHTHRGIDILMALASRELDS